MNLLHPENLTDTAEMLETAITKIVRYLIMANYLDSSRNVQCPPSVSLDYICKTVEFRSTHVQG